MSESDISEIFKQPAWDNTKQFICVRRSFKMESDKYGNFITPIFKPSLEELANFAKYIAHLESLDLDFAIVSYFVLYFPELNCCDGGNRCKFLTIPKFIIAITKNSGQSTDRMVCEIKKRWRQFHAQKNNITEAWKVAVCWHWSDDRFRTIHYIQRVPRVGTETRKIIITRPKIRRWYMRKKLLASRFEKQSRLLRRQWLVFVWRRCRAVEPE